MSRARKDWLDPAPLREWIDRELERLSEDETIATPEAELIRRMDLRKTHGEEGGARALYRWRFESKALNPSDITHALEAAGSALWEVYGVEEIDLEADAYCSRCKDTVTPIDGVCPWCETEVATTRARMWCEREDRLVFPADDGSCWRCGDQLQKIPWGQCACGCRREIPLFDPQGRPRIYVRGHAPSTDPGGKVDAAPFAEYLRKQMQELDLIGALARAHGISRDVVASLLAGRSDTIDRAVARRALWTAARTGTGKGLPPRPGAPQFADIYPEEVRAKVCPDCGGGKAPHAQKCRDCFRRDDRERRRVERERGITREPTRPTQIREELLVEAYEAHQGGATILDAARSIFDRLPSTNVEGCAQQLAKEWRKRGWEVRTRTRSKVAA